MTLATPVIVSAGALLHKLVEGIHVVNPWR
jgi:hypothetical protein